MPVYMLMINILGAAPGLAGDECSCRGSDGRIFHERDLACITTAKGPKFARCEMALNNTTWTIVGDNCPEARRFSPVRLATFAPANDDRPRAR